MIFRQFILQNFDVSLYEILEIHFMGVHGDGGRET